MSVALGCTVPVPFSRTKEASPDAVGAIERLDNTGVTHSGIDAHLDRLALSGDAASDARDGLEVDQLSIPAIEDRQACLHRAVENFCPDVVYGHTHKAMIEMHGLGQPRARRVVDLHGDLAIERLEAAGCSIPFPQRDVHLFPEGESAA